MCQVLAKRSKLSSLQKALMDNPTADVVAQERIVTKELGDLLRAEEKLLYQKSRIQFLKEGDQNIGYYFRQVAVRQKVNTIKALQNDHGQWVESYDGIFEVLVQFFSNFLSVTDSSVQGISNGLLRDILGVEFTPEMQSSLIAPITRKEIRDVLFAMKGDKAPGPDGKGIGGFMEEMRILTIFCLIKSDIRLRLANCFILDHVDPY
ncbi:hypothetical protein V6N11_048357 [Hibiscus sabdariffa]|uniref:Uncharacterized protein n=1 Tax=Hibiscus sabdariffa TaxID=183260 RepID=A0ABR2PVG4_9ROSI